MMKKELTNVDDYINSFPQDVKGKLTQIRLLILENCKGTVESISYSMPAYKLNDKPLVYFGGFKNHIGFYGTPTIHNFFKKELEKFKQGKGSVQFPHKEELPEKLIKAMLKLKIKEVNDMAKMKNENKKRL